MTEDTQVWIAQGIEKRYRVVSNLRTYGEFDSRFSAEALIGFLIAGGKFSPLKSPQAELHLVGDDAA